MTKLLCWLKVNLIASKLISQALIDMEIRHEEFVAILKEKVRSENEKQEIMRLSTIKLKT